MVHLQQLLSLTLIVNDGCLQDVYKTAEGIKKAGWELQKEPTTLPGIGTKLFSLLDPDGYKIVFVDNADFLKELES